jgi:hypothetical protein
MPRPDGPQFRKVGNHKMYRHGIGNWETVDNYHFSQGTPPHNLWNVHDLRSVDEESGKSTSWQTVFETQHGNLRHAHSEFRQHYPERDSGEPILDY